MAAPYDRHAMPSESAYCQIRCCKLSTDGISFYSPVRLSGQRFVIRLSDFDEPAVLLAACLTDCREDATGDGPSVSRHVPVYQTPPVIDRFRAFASGFISVAPRTRLVALDRFAYCVVSRRITQLADSVAPRKNHGDGTQVTDM